MLKIYNTLDEVPEADRQHYVKSDGKYIPQLSDDHPVLVHNKQLLSEKANATARVKELEADIAAASEKSIPRGHVAIPKADADAITGYKALGTVDEVKVKLTEHGTLKEAEARRAREDSLVSVAKALGYENVEAFKRLPNLPDFDIRGEGDKRQVFALVKDGEKTIEKPAREFLESSADHAPFLDALKAKPTGVTVNTTGSTTHTQSAPGDPFAWAKDFAKSYTETVQQPGNDLFKSFNERSSA